MCIRDRGNGGTNFDAKTRRNSTDLEDIFIAHIAGMDAMARALESAAALLNESPYCKMLSDRYASFDSGKGKEFEEGKLTLEDVVAYACLLYTSIWTFSSLLNLRKKSLFFPI